MAYCDFDLRTARERFSLTLIEDRDLFAATPEAAVPDRLRDLLEEWSPVALATNTEKARSEMIIAPIPMEAVRLSERRLSLFSGVSFDVDRQLGLVGVCDYLLTRSPERFYLSQPVVSVVEAKREDIPSGLGQCVAAMVGAREFNARAGLAPAPIFGAVTTGNAWRFLRLDGAAVEIDRREHYLDRVGKILGIVTLAAAA